MQNKLLVLLFLLILAFKSYSQLNNTEINEFKTKLLTAKNDSARLTFAQNLANGYRFSNVDSSFLYNDLAIKLATKLKLPSKKAYLLSLKGATLLESGKLPESLQLQFEALNISEQIKDTNTKAYALNRIGNTYMELGNYQKANAYYFRSRDLFHSVKDMGMYYNEISNIGNIYELMQLPDSALHYQQMVVDASETKENINNRNDYTRPEIMFRMGNAYKAKGNNEQALHFYKKGVAESHVDNDLRNFSMNNLLIAQLYEKMNQPDSSLKYAYNSLQTASTISFRKGMYEASALISGLFKNKNEYDSAYKYLLSANVEKDSLTGTKRFQELQQIVLDEQEHERQSESKRIDEQNKEMQYALLGGLAIVLIVAFLLYRNNKHKQKANILLERQKQKVETTLSELKSTQSQLIQSEKMASLGELTAGIAHEIQNPLNFVNNFSDVNKELLVEMKDEMNKGNLADANEIANDVIANEEKINHHGKRADAIVKGMLQHSQSSTGKKEPTDFNALCDEYLRLSYHGLRAKDKDFNATMKTDFDESIGKINIIPQDMGRVLLNLYNNAFYAVSDKKRMNPDNFEPTVSISTKKLNDKIQIIVKDNGNGIPQNIVDKIFQPFFTTKPTGQGTGLGLSLSYDIVKAHGGEISAESFGKVERKVDEGNPDNFGKGEGTTFIIQLPLNN